jgi:dTDP-4-dehydrorhamnose 3,5-epimerase
MDGLFRAGVIDGVIWKPLALYRDPRGWLCELYRNDEVDEHYRPVMAYVSQTEPGVTRGPHEHVAQADYFCFIGPSTFRLFLWDNRPGSSTYRLKQVEDVGEQRPMAVIVPPGVVHAYRNVGAGTGLVFNAANQLYKGQGRAEPVDEIRHEHDPQSIYRLE